MYLSRLKLNIQKRGTMIALSTPSMFHGAVERSFAGERPHCLWRIDVLHSEYYLLILSENIPDFSNLENEYGFEGTVETRSYDGLLARLDAGGKWQFRLCANPTYCAYDGNNKKRGRVCAHTTVEQQRSWLVRQGERYGFIVEQDGFEIVRKQWYRFGKNKKMVSILAVTYEGVLSITDRQLFIGAMKNGIGRGKAYGMGMLTLMRPKDEH